MTKALTQIFQNPRTIPGHATIPDLCDFCGPVDFLITRLQGIAHLYGGDSVVSFDGGYSNVEVVVVSADSIKKYDEAQRVTAKDGKRKTRIQHKIRILKQELDQIEAAEKEMKSSK